MQLTLKSSRPRVEHLHLYLQNLQRKEKENPGPWGLGVLLLSCNILHLNKLRDNMKEHVPSIYFLIRRIINVINDDWLITEKYLI
jgi:hypothetical protein